jgi:hypothetical protein
MKRRKQKDRKDKGREKQGHSREWGRESERERVGRFWRVEEERARRLTMRERERGEK